MYSDPLSPFDHMYTRSSYNDEKNRKNERKKDEKTRTINYYKEKKRTQVEEKTKKLDNSRFLS